MAIKRGEYYDDLEIMSHEAREEYLTKKLRRTISHAYHHAPATRRLFDRNGLQPTDIRTIADLVKLPVTRKTDVIEWQKQEPPYGGLLAIPEKEVERVFISPGPIYEPQQVARIKWFAKPFWAAGFRKGDVVINTFTYHMSPGGVLMHESLRDCGATVIPAGIGNTDAQIQIMRDLKITGFTGTPSFLNTIIKRAEELGYNFKRDFSLKRAWFTGEMLPPSLRKIFEQEYSIITAQAYAVTEPGGAIAYECTSHSGMHFMDDYVIEIVDPATGKQLEEGEVGEIVVTPIHNLSWGLIRFGTGDLSGFTAEPCFCGRTANRLAGIIGRTGDAVKVRGMFIVSKQVEQVITNFEDITKFQLVVTRKSERDEITLRAELKPGTKEIKARLMADLNEKFQNICRVKLDKIELLDSGTLPEQYHRIADQRVWK